MLNLSLTGDDFPSPWKHAIVTHLLTKASLDDSIVSSYRPVSKFPYLSTIIERIVHRQLISHLEEFKLLPDFQSAYCRGHSTETAVIKVYSDLIDAISNGKFALLSLFDLTAAFDTVDHNILLHRLDNILLPWPATPVDALILRWPNPVYSTWRQIDYPTTSGIWRTSRLCLVATAVNALHG